MHPTGDVYTINSSSLSKPNTLAQLSPSYAATPHVPNCNAAHAKYKFYPTCPMSINAGR